MSNNTILSQMPIDLGDNLKLRFATPDDIEAGDAQFPELTFLQLLCGRCRTAELASNFVDCWTNDTAAILLDCLFPPFTGEVWHL